MWPDGFRQRVDDLVCSTSIDPVSLACVATPEEWAKILDSGQAAGAVEATVTAAAAALGRGTYVWSAAKASCTLVLPHGVTMADTVTPRRWLTDATENPRPADAADTWITDVRREVSTHSVMRVPLVILVTIAIARDIRTHGHTSRT